ncbi:MAG TPA: FadR/GntR family transcriptional regulator [Candidatus Paceibacterota bacterium]|nr:FadR family transcriptional regulator [Verrucomicrobiota bacterium]HOX02206.1 FadR/GntR family transcriptional regulator [Verrucomicrobiota bacterium]HRZ45053.1 FadR/GntR family transcriptional regulator [Candidatus Paceibacterota bacterium]HRZ92079.1 FadR/GntR family transcriptional regulator [Candidatus Paceibacterota bacterium]
MQTNNTNAAVVEEPGAFFGRKDLVSQVTDWIREQILSGAFGVGSELPAEGSLATQLGVSRNVMRESMRNLRMQGLIEISQGRRPRVKPADPIAVTNTLEALLRRSNNSFLHLMQVRVPLEVEIAALAAQHVTPDDLARLAALIEDLKANRSLEEWIDADVAFHQFLAQATGNPIFLLIMDSIRSLLRTFQENTYSHVDTSHAVQGHTNILRAIQRQDSQGARTAMLNHLQDAFQDLSTGTRAA